MNNNLQQSSRFVFMQTILVAFFIDIPALNQIFVSFVPGLSGRIMMLLYLLCGISTCILAIVSIFKRYFVNKNLFLLIGFILLGYVMTSIFTPYSDLSFINFTVYTLLAMLIVLLLNVDGKLLISLIMTLTFIGLLNINIIFATSVYRYETISMGMSYAFMPTVVAAIVYFCVYFKKESTIKKLILVPVLLVNAIYLFKIMQFGSRGVVLCFICCFVFFFCIKYDEVNNKLSFKGYKAFFISIIVVLVLLNIWTFFEKIEGIFEAVGFHINAVNKFFRLASASNGDISNGRNAIYEATISGILQSPMWGHGYSTTMNNLGFVYPHNFMLQLLYDGGLLLTLPIFILVCAGIVRWCKSCNKDEFAVIAALIFMSVPGALFTGNLWENNRLWLTFAVLTVYSSRSWILNIKQR